MICEGCRKVNHTAANCHNTATCPCHHKQAPKEKLYSPELLEQMKGQGLI